MYDMKKTKTSFKLKVLLIFLAVVVALNVSYFMEGIYNAVARSVIFKSGVVLKNNVSISAGSIDQRNGSMSTTSNAYPKSLGGVDDYNNNQTMPTDTFSENFTYCTSANNYCSTNESVVCSGATNYKCYQDNRTNLVWSDYLNTGTNVNWFVANNCQYPNGLPGDDGVCNVNAEVACQCVKQTVNETGYDICEFIGGGNWRLPHQKELMQVYIDGSWGSGMPNTANTFWSATTPSNATQYAWGTTLYHGTTYSYSKTSTHDSRCVRR